MISDGEPGGGILPANFSSKVREGEHPCHTVGYGIAVQDTYLHQAHGVGCDPSCVAPRIYHELDMRVCPAGIVQKVNAIIVVIILSHHVAIHPIV